MIESSEWREMLVFRSFYFATKRNEPIEPIEPIEPMEYRRRARIPPAANYSFGNSYQSSGIKHCGAKYVLPRPRR